ncbi:SDR family oxidoreductase [Porifericola rhodea]|uniref:SDR family oxidoreductase n=1 Tax=Porifericola rhodea TaxID=930972 RepID=UPI002666AA0C|nr:SDR family oxidoreductase [Porifericola rhodea]WKN31175.1 SDR family oxidoreductase [Porifericola rhodea]
MKIAVTSASGQLGKAIVQSLKVVAGKENIVAIARTPENAKSLGVEVRSGDYNHKEDFDEALKGIDTLLLVSGNGEPEKRKQQHANVIEAAKSAGVSKIVYTSIIGPLEESDFSVVVKSNRHTEDYLKNSGLDWVIGRNGLYLEPDLEYIDQYKKDGKISNCAGHGRCAYTTRTELAFAYAKMLTEEKHNGEIYNLSGNPITQYELAELINDVYGTKLTYEPLSVQAYREERINELGEFMGTIISGIYEGIKNGGMNVNSDYYKASGREHISIIEAIRNYHASN